ncbi:MAG: hypothetical protein CM15mP21_5610 [Hyphomicrobiales bacterium]|nr:MAG: hypothetical protein CM15mP21_5610 [Hyphomicrobiales bacterium]
MEEKDDSGWKQKLPKLAKSGLEAAYQEADKQTRQEAIAALRER